MKHLSDYLVREDGELWLDPFEDEESGESGWQATLNNSDTFDGKTPLEALEAANAWCARKLGRTAE